MQGLINLIFSGFKEPSSVKTEPKSYHTTEELLTTHLRRYYPNNPTAVARFNPKVVLTKIKIKIDKSKESCIDLTPDFTNYLPKLPEINEIEFQGIILSHWTSLEGDKNSYRVRWFPFGILEDEDVIKETANVMNLKKKVKLDEMSYMQKKKVVEGILRGVLK